jgi:hypothetical protein
MSDILRLNGGGQEIDLYSWLTPRTRAGGVEALAGIEGFGVAGVSPRWATGAGAGSRWRGSRVERREVKIPLWVYADDRVALSTLVSALSTATDPSRGMTRLSFGLPDDDEWWIDVVRDGDIDWKRKVDSDDRTYFKSQLNAEAGDPFWTRNRPEFFEVTRGDNDEGLLPELAKLRVGSGAAFGTREVYNVGDTDAWPVWTIKGPTTQVTLVGDGGETLVWNGPLLAGETLTIDSRSATVVDQAGENRYSGLDPAPRFWSIRPGRSTVTVEASLGEATTSVYCQWWPRRWGVV